MLELNFDLPDGITFNKVEEEESHSKDGFLLRKVSCPKCDFVIKAVIFENYGRFSGKIVRNENHEIWQGKLASDSNKSRNQILDVFNKKIKDHLEKCKG
jgi:hypothetical protein